MTTGKFIKFPSIEKFSDVNATVKRRFTVEDRPTVTYRGKVKLHGTNAGIRVDTTGAVTCFKRSGVCNVQNDNAGFANWVETVKDRVSVRGEDYVLFGEWAGPGIQKKVAVSDIEKKTFFVFAVLWIETEVVWVAPDLIKTLVAQIPEIEVIPWGTETFAVDFRLQSSMEAFSSAVGNLVEACDKVDPYIKARYGIEGIGEGYVFVPVDEEVDELGPSFKTYHDYLFKAKGKSHSVAAHESTNKIQIDPAILDGATAFAKNFVTEARCEQGLQEACGGTASTATIGKFMGWIGPDVKKESANELEASGLEWKYVAKAVNQQARDWFILAIERNL